MNPDNYKHHEPRRAADRDGRRRRRKSNAIAKRHELRVADELGGQRVPQSGAGAAKGDVLHEVLLVEAKTTDNASLSVKRAWLAKIAAEAAAAGRVPGLAIRFSGNPDPTAVTDWVAVPAEWLRDLLDRDRRGGESR